MDKVLVYPEHMHDSAASRIRHRVGILIVGPITAGLEFF